MISHPFRCGRLVGAALLLLLMTGAASAASFTQDLSFQTGSRSLWGPGKGLGSFGADGSAGIPRTTAFGVQVTPAIGGAYDFSASGGTVSANVNGRLSATYDDLLAAPGRTQVVVDFDPTSGGFSTDLGAQVDITGYVDHIPFGSRWDFCFYCQDWQLDTGSSAAPGFGVTRSGSDSVSVAGVGPSFGSIASATANVNATQTSNLRLDGFTGLLTYTNQTTGTSGVTALALSSASVLDIDLPEVGDWDFGFVGLDLDSTFWSTMGASLSFDIDVFAVVDESWAFASLDLLDTGGFALDFGSQSVASAFTISVPEPGPMFLVASGLLGLAFFGRPRRSLAPRAEEAR